MLTVIIALLAFLVVASGIEGVPLLLLGIRRGAIQVFFDNSPQSRELLLRSANLRQWLDRLGELGFVLVGVKVEKLPLWGHRYPEVALASPDKEAYASIALHPDGEPASLYFYTPFEGGGMVFTRNFRGREAEGERLSVRNVVTDDFRIILQDHLGRVQILKHKGSSPVVSADQRARIEATEAFYRSEYARGLGPSLWSPPIWQFLASLACLVAVILWSVFQPGGR